MTRFADERSTSWSEAREDHAVLLHLEGVHLKELGRRLGVSREGARYILNCGAERWRRSIARARWRFESEAHRSDPHAVELCVNLGDDV